MAKQSREKMKKAKARKEKRMKAAKAARNDANAPGADAAAHDQTRAFESRPFSVDSVGKSIGGARLPRRSKKG